MKGKCLYCKRMREAFVEALGGVVCKSCALSNFDTLIDVLTNYYYIDKLNDAKEKQNENSQ